ncbi:UDP-N-acetylmuramoyl-L-alanyl-D-glutamate--2,6-diaminopimelate ligase [Motiliproteus sp. MSK22-1]|nr:UDP-N-acetylmuramoyl-L-alanyl-D-glutamate--2,6-diaminopimelate ligase [Motiliproteus sp. MSK22-1]
MAEQLSRLGLQNVSCTGLTIDSRRVQKGDLFLACKGEQFNGLDFVPGAIEKGAVAILINSEQDLQCNDKQVPVIAVDRLEQRLSELGNRFYHKPSEQLHMIGITGTNGKTSCSHFVAQALDLLSSKSAVIGTNGYGFLSSLDTASHTTPDALYLQRMFSDLHRQGAENLVMEVSSHALDQRRVSGVSFDQAVFTNLTRDHLDYHGDMEGYGAAKAKLFTDYGISKAIINLDDPFADKLLRLIPKTVEITGYSLGESAIDKVNAETGSSQKKMINQIWVSQSSLGPQGIEVSLQTSLGQISFKTSIIGAFNLSNLMATLAVLIGRGFQLDQLSQIMARLQGVAGRMESVADGQGRLIVVDYAHTPDALEKALVALRSHCDGQLWCVFGCGGDRDTGKRTEMAAIAERLSDCPVVTSDNPRTENPELIIEDILDGFTSTEGVIVEADRAKAIALTLLKAKAGDVVLIAGKGHENYQEICGIRHPFSDVDMIRSCQRVGGTVNSDCSGKKEASGV